jgi:hypothetical protein
VTSLNGYSGEIRCTAKSAPLQLRTNAAPATCLNINVGKVLHSMSSGRAQRTACVPEPVIGALRGEGPERAHCVISVFLLRALAAGIVLQLRKFLCR